MPHHQETVVVRRLRAVPDGDDGPAPETRLLQRVATGDQQAFADLYDLVAPSVVGVVRGVLRDPAQSEEVAQEVLVEVWKSATRFDADRGSARTWILTIAHRRAVDRVRSEQAHRNRDEKVAVRDRGRAFDEVAEAVEARLEHRAVRDALGSLTKLQREAVELAYYRGLTYREVAEVLGTPLGTIKTRMRDGMIRLRDALEVA